MKTKDKFALWGFGILILSGISNFLKIYEYGSIDAWFYSAFEFSNFWIISILAFQFFYVFVDILASIYLCIIYPILLIKKDKNKK